MWCQHCISKKWEKEAGRTAWKQTQLWGCSQQCVVHLFIPTMHVNCASKLSQLHLHGIYLMSFTHGLIIFYLAAVTASWWLLSLLLQYSPHRISILHFLNANSHLLIQRVIFFQQFPNQNGRKSQTWNSASGHQRISSVGAPLKATWCHLCSAGSLHLGVLLFPTSDPREHWALLLYFIEKMFPYSWVSS